ncbi:MAG: hypothetical protein GC137_10210 [Alphaproteobacteria bacterium]|nr:hypothetical protein [Alphaproteobacteria bacterium]
MSKKDYSKPAKKEAEFIRPPNLLRAKVGHGGLSEEVLDRAQNLLESHSENFIPMAENYLNKMMEGVLGAQNAKGDISKSEAHIAKILLPCVQLKANGAMFHYELVTRIADIYVQFMEQVEILDKETLDISVAFHNTIKLIVSTKMKGGGGTKGDALYMELKNACNRYLEKHNAEI